MNYERINEQLDTFMDSYDDLKDLKARRDHVITYVTEYYDEISTLFCEYTQELITDCRCPDCQEIGMEREKELKRGL